MSVRWDARVYSMPISIFYIHMLLVIKVTVTVNVRYWKSGEGFYKEF
jgi:hypothetical protein